VPYAENYNVRFNSDGRIDYDLLIAKIMPEIFEKKLRTLGVNVSSEDIVLDRSLFHMEPHLEIAHMRFPQFQSKSRKLQNTS
jgi:hypothetical protein